MRKILTGLGDRALGLIVPKARASACLCWWLECPNGNPKECCKHGGHLYCDECE
ncbi:hypothetical protein [Catenuloplanes japonicus]|uniref:hypothetical protein n=1 Tax=Catenuloplanes japonicus TaxID=33876 RepID=UPI000AF71F79|nr:hypothetical protein [Catenuloplanes japonicus]